MTNHNRSFRRSAIIISMLCIMMVVSLVATSVAWFKNSIDAVGPNINTGKIDVSLTEFHFDGANWNSVQKYTSPDGIAEEYTKIEISDSFTMDLSGERSQDDVFYVIEKKDGSIPLDVSLGFVVDGYDNNASVVDDKFAVIGGFWYRLQNVTEEYHEADNYFTTGENNPINNDNKDLYKQLYLINSDVRTSRLDTSDVAVYRLTCGYVNTDSGIVNRYNRSYGLNINFCVAQIGGLEGGENGEIHYVNTEQELRDALNEYTPRDAIILGSDITYYGDLIIDRPLDLYVQGYKLNIEGNLTLSYPNRGEFLINTQRGGQIFINKTGNAGSFIVDLPNAELELVGSGNSDIGYGDIYVENEYYVSASYNNGMILSSSYVRDISDFDEGLKDMTIGNATKISISRNTMVGKLIADINVAQIYISNYGNVESVDFRNVAYGEFTGQVITDQTVDNIPIQSRLENAGIVEKVYLNANTLPGMTTHGLLMRYNQNRYIDAAEGRYHGNTRLINRLGGQIDEVHSAASIPYIDGSNEPIGYIIEEDSNIIYVEKVLTDEEGNALATNEFIVRYANRYNVDGTPNYDTTLKDVLDWYEGDLSDAHKFTITCYGGKVLTADDYDTLNEYTSLVELDLSGATSDGGETPEGAFAALGNLAHLQLPNDTVLSAHAFVGTALDEVTLQSSYVTIEANAFADMNGNLLIKYLHLMQSGAKYDNLLPAKQFIFGVDDITLGTLREKYPQYPHRFFLDAQKYGDYFIRVISGDVCELAVYVGSSFDYQEESKSLIQDVNRYSSFDFNEFSYRENGEIKTYKIDAFDDYAFYGMIKNTNNSIEPTFRNARRIGNYAFYNCTGIDGSLTFSGTVSIGSYAFGKCTGVERVLGVDASNSKIESYAFVDCTSIYEVYAPGFTHVGAYAFKNCKGIYAVRMPQLYSMGKAAFLQASLVHYLETALIIESEGWDGINGSSIEAIHAKTYNAYTEEARLNYVLNMDALPADVQIPANLPNIFTCGSGFQGGSNITQIIIPVGYESYVTHLSTRDNILMSKPTASYTGNGKYLKLDPATGICERWETPYRFVNGNYTPADYLYEEVESGARLISCFADEIVGEYHLPDVIYDGDKTVYVTEMDMCVFFTTHLGTTRTSSSTETCSLYFGEHIRFIENKVFTHEPNTPNGHYATGTAARQMQLVNFGGLQELTPCIVNNQTAYNRDANIKEVFAPNVITIKEGALKNTTAGIILDDAHFPSLLTIEKEAFYQNSSLTSVNHSKVTSIGEKAFYNCTVLESVNCSGAQIVSTSAFASCKVLREVHMATVKIVGTSAFEAATQNYKPVTVLETVYMPEATTIKSLAFNGCEKITSLEFLSALNIEANAFKGCAGLVSINLPAIITIENAAFTGCTKLQTVSAELAETVGTSTFSSLTALTTINMPNVHTIKAGAFSACTALASIEFPNLLTLEKDAFKGCMGLTTVNLPAIITIENAAFSGCTKLQTVSAELAETVGASAFSSLAALTTVNMPKVQTIKSNAFSSCSGLVTIEFPSALTIESGAFQNCSKLESASFASIRNIEKAIFNSNCTKLREISMPLLESAGDSAFSGLKGLIFVNMPNVVSLGASCFSSCTSLAEFSSDKLTGIGTGCFNGCTALASINMPNLEAVPSNAFWGSGLINVYLPSATSIGDRAFQDCYYLKTMNIPNVTILGINVFYNCTFWWINMPSFDTSISNAQWSKNYKWSVYGDYGNYNNINSVSSFRIFNGGVQTFTLNNTGSKAFSTSYDPSNVIFLRSDGIQITYDQIWRDWTEEEEEIPFRIYAKGTEPNTATLIALNGFYPSETANGKYTLNESFVVGDTTYQVTGLLNGVASKVDFGLNDLVLPVTITEIPAHFAYNNATLKGISASGVVTINTYAFYKCTGLTSAIFPNATSLKDHTFEDCTSLVVTNFSALERIEGGAYNSGAQFKNCTSITSISFPSLNFIYDYTNSGAPGIFEGCTNLVSVSFGPGFNQILRAANMFKNATSLGTITFDGCPTIDKAYNWSISENTQIFVSFDNLDTFIANNPTLSNITGFFEDIYQDAQTDITYYLRKLSDGEYEISLIIIPTEYASDRIDLPSVYNGVSIVSLSGGAWSGIEAQGIKTVALPEALKFLSDRQNIAASVESLEIAEGNSTFATVAGVLYSKDMSVLIAYPKSKLDTSFVLPESVEMISSFAFSGTANLITLTIPQKVIVCDSAFYECVKLQNVVFTGVDTSLFVGAQTFVDCVLENTISVWVPTGTIDSYKNAVVGDHEIYSKFVEGTP